MTAEQYADLHRTTTGEYGGLGIQISSRDGWVTAVSILPGTPAERQGMRVGDRFLEINGKSAEGWSDDDAVKELRGPRGTSVQLKVQRVGVEQPITFTITREDIQVRSVPYSYMVAPGVGYANLIVFSQTSTQELRAAIDGLRAQGARSLVLDLRGNPGGLLDEGVSISDLFLPSGDAVVETRARNPRESETYRAKHAGDLRRAQGGGAGGRLQRQRGGDRGRRAAGPRPRGGAGHHHLRQRLCAVAVPALGRQLPQDDDGQVVHAGGPLHPEGRQGGCPGRGGGGSRR